MSGNISIYTDGGARNNPGPAASAFVVFNAEHVQVYSGSSYLGPATNNFAEYEAVRLASAWLTTLKPAPASVSFYLDSQLVVNQMTGKFRIKDPVLQKTALQIMNMLKGIKEMTYSFSYIPREQNTLADLLVNQTLDAALK